MISAATFMIMPAFTLAGENDSGFFISVNIGYSIGFIKNNNNNLPDDLNIYVH